MSPKNVVVAGRVSDVELDDEEDDCDGDAADESDWAEAVAAQTEQAARKAIERSVRGIEAMYLPRYEQLS